MKLFAAAYLPLILAPAAAQNGVRIDGVADEAFWSQVPASRLRQAATVQTAGVPAALAGEVRCAVASGYLYVAVRMPEPSARFTARSIGRNPSWEEEDIVRVLVSGDVLAADWVLQSGPLGAHMVERKGLAVNKPTFLMASRIAPSAAEWTAEFAVPLYELGTPPVAALNVTVERVRAARPGMPEIRFRWPANAPTARIVELKPAPPLSAPTHAPPLTGNAAPPLAVAATAALPALDASWASPAWRAARAWPLLRDEPMSRQPRHATHAKALHDGTTLAILVRCEEPDRAPPAAATERDGAAVTAGDNVQVYLATTGSAFAQFALNPAGGLLDAAGRSGGQYISRPRLDWNSSWRGVALPGDGAWTARFDIPLSEAAAVLGEDSIPATWRILIVRMRGGRGGSTQEISALPVMESSTALGPARYRRLTLLPSGVAAAAETAPTAAPTFDTNLPGVLPRPRRDMLERHLRERIVTAAIAEKSAWDQTKSAADWQRFTQPRIQALAASLGRFPERTPLQTHVSKEFPGAGYRRQDLVYQSRPGLWVTANLYLPATSTNARMPAIVIVHSHHRPRTQAELQDMGILWARAGAAVLVMDQIGSGERLQNYPWNREAYHSRYVMGMQLETAGESLMQWMVWDTLRGVDLLTARPDVDPNRIALLGAVAGGGDPAGVAAALDPRIAVVAPFNFGEATPESPRFLKDKNRMQADLADPGWGSWETTRNLRGSVAGQFFPWVICASVAPRRFLYSYEMGWNVDDLPAWARYRQVFGFYGAEANLAEAHGFGPFPGPGECTNIGPAQRRTMYPAMERWLGLRAPEKEPEDRRPESELAALTPELAARISMKPVHQLARDAAMARLAEARATLAKLAPAARRAWLRDAWKAKLGGNKVDPPASVAAARTWTRDWNGAAAAAEAYVLQPEPGIDVPLLLLRPRGAATTNTPLAIAIAEGGKDRFLAHRRPQIQSLLNAGIAVCLADVRGTGETAPDFRRHPLSASIALASTEAMFGSTMLGARLKDLRTAIVWARRLDGIDARRIGVWGDSFSPPNPARPMLNELVNWFIGPDIQRQAEPLGGLLALLAGLFEEDLRAVASHGSLSGFASLFDDAFAYIPFDVIVPGALAAGDLNDIAANLGSVRHMAAGVVDARNRAVSAADSSPAAWLAGQLR